MTAVVRTLLLVAVVAMGGWWTWFVRERTVGHERQLAARDAEIQELASGLRERDRRIDELASSVRELEVRVEEQARLIIELETALALSKIDHRIARLEVLEQVAVPGEPDQVRTRLRFVEIDAEGQPIGPPIEVEIEGKLVYIEALVIKFGDQYVERGDALRGTSICLFRRLFGAEQRPSEGVALDASGARPLPYRGDQMPDPFYDELWERFWDYANDPELAREKGIRAIHGEAPFTELRPGKTYRVELRSSGGLTIQPD